MYVIIMGGRNRNGSVCCLNPQKMNVVHLTLNITE